MTPTLYWAANSIGPSFMPYFEAGDVVRPDRWERVEVPTAAALFPADLPVPPREYGERAYNIQRWTNMPRGGHFAAAEEPELLAEDLRTFFRPLR
jgi:pimeloyl-ACP methyl ester carboxylesterase